MVAGGLAFYYAKKGGVIIIKGYTDWGGISNLVPVFEIGD